MIANRHTRVLDATVACVAEFGFQRPTVTITTRAGVGPATLFRTFATKELLAAIPLRAREPKRALGRPAPTARRDPAGGAGPFAAVRPLPYQALGDSSLQQGLQLPQAAVVPLLTVQWLVAVEMEARSRGNGAPDSLPLLRQLHASWWRNTGLSKQVLAQPDAATQAKRASLNAILHQNGIGRSPQGSF